MGSIFLKFTSSNPENITSRIQLNILALEMIEDHPLFGVGLNNAIVAGMNYPIFQYYYRAFKLPPVVHNYYLLLTTEIGIIGTVLFLSVVFSVIVLAVKSLKYQSKLSPIYLRLSFAAGLFGYLISDLFGYSLRKFEISYIFWCHLGLIVLLVRLSKITKVTSPDNQSLNLVVLSGKP